MGVNRIIYIRTDGNSQIASGHLMRCLSIARACQELGMTVCFLVSDEESLSLLTSLLAEKEAFSVLRLKTAVYNDMEQELPELLTLLSQSANPVMPDSDFSAADFSMKDSVSANILIDSYFVTEKYLTALRPFAKTAYIDDLQLFDYPTDLLVNYDVIPDSAAAHYKAAYQNAGKLLLGASYAPLRNQFQNRKIIIKEQVTDILLTTGGSDPYHFCLNFIGYFSEMSASYANTLTLHVVIGKLNADKNALYELAEKYPFLKLHENVSHMASLMEHCDLAISASGTTLYELCALGLPTISFTMADNQLTPARAFEEAGAIPYAGDIRTDKDKVLRNITDFVTRLSCKNDISVKNTGNPYSYEMRKSAHEAMRKLVDGNGAMRIAKAMLNL